MKQITQNLKTGKSIISDVPLHSLKAGHLLIQTQVSLISAGTERMLVDFGKSSYLQKAKQQPEKVKEVIQKVKTDGLLTTYEAVKSKLDQPFPMGYCNVGRVAAVGSDVEGFKIGDLVASNGPHAEYVSVPKNLCAKVPTGISDQKAVFTVLGSIALQSIRLVKPEFGETIVVSGLGLIGLLAVQFLRRHGCRVIALDYNSDRLSLAEQYGAQPINLSIVEDPVEKVTTLINQPGVDAVLIAAATKSNDPVSQAAKMCRKRGRIVLVGVTGLELSRADFYEKELSFQVSCSYGPGRYDESYEKKGIDYPFGLVRWTEQRNFQAVLHAMDEGWLLVDDLISDIYDVDQVENAYKALVNDKKALGILLKFPHESLPDRSEQIELQTSLSQSSTSTFNTNDRSNNLRVSFIGAGNYASRVLIPAFKQSKVYFNSIYTTTGLSGKHVATKFEFERASTYLDQLWCSDDADLVVIATRHNSHAELVCKALDSGKHVFVEKPLALTYEEIREIETVYRKNHGKYKVMVGFNRRFSPFVRKIKDLMEFSSSPMSINMIINAGSIASDHWTQNDKVGGGRIVGEACHFIDLARFLTGYKIIDSSINYMTGQGVNTFDTAVISLKFSDGSIASINYLANGHKTIAKERIEIFSQGKVIQLDNFRKLTAYGFKGFNKMKTIKQNKGQQECVQMFLDTIHDQKDLIPLEEIIDVANVSVKLSMQA